MIKHKIFQFRNLYVSDTFNLVFKLDTVRSIEVLFIAEMKYFYEAYSREADLGLIVNLINN